MQSEEPMQLPPEFRQQPLSARLLEDFALCPRKFLLSFFVSRHEEQRFRGGPAALHQAVRQALVDCYGHGGPATAAPEFLLDSFEAHWQGELCTDSMEEEQLHAQGLQMLRDYHDDHRADAVDILATDRSFVSEIEGQALVAVADVVLQPAGREAPDVTRFVTSRRPDNAAALAQDLSAQLLWLLACEHYGSDPAPRILFYALRDRSATAVHVEPDAAAYLRRDLASRAARLYRETDFSPVKGKYCRWCRVRRRCPLWQR